jgi:hypothetical protein
LQPLMGRMTFILADRMEQSGPEQELITSACKGLNRALTV